MSALAVRRAMLTRDALAANGLQLRPAHHPVFSNRHPRADAPTAVATPVPTPLMVAEWPPRPLDCSQVRASYQRARARLGGSGAAPQRGWNSSGPVR